MSTSDKIKATLKAREEVSRKKMMADAVDKLAYFKTIKDIVENAPAPRAASAKKETLYYFDSLIRDLEMDVEGKPRYCFNLHYPVVFGAEYNGERPEFADKEFKSIAEMIEFIHEHVNSNDILFDKEDYEIPTAKLIQDMLSIREKVDIDINPRDEDDEDEEDEVPLFTASWKRINY